MEFRILSLIFIASILNLPQAIAGDTTLNDAWYTMQSGSTPWGYYHEVIQLNKGRYFYRYDMTKNEGGHLYSENIGGVAEEDLTPVAFNLNKGGDGAAQSFNGTYKAQDGGGVFNVIFKGSVERTLTRHVGKGVILEVFFPVWLHKHFEELKSGFRSSVTIFTESPDTADYVTKVARFQFVEERKAGKDSCKAIKVELDSKISTWCVTKSGALVDMVVGNNEVLVKRVASQSDAKAFLKQK